MVWPVFQIVLQLYNGAPMAEALAAAMPSRYAALTAHRSAHDICPAPKQTQTVRYPTLYIIAVILYSFRLNDAGYAIAV